MLVDPSLAEEQVMEGKLVVGMNVHGEVCVLQMMGGVAILPEQVSVMDSFGCRWSFFPQFFFIKKKENIRKKVLFFCLLSSSFFPWRSTSCKTCSDESKPNKKEVIHYLAVVSSMAAVEILGWPLLLL